MDAAASRQAPKALLDSYERFRLFYEHSPLAYQSLDSEGRILEINPAWLRALGYERAEVVGRWFGDFLTTEHQSLFSERFSSFGKTGEIRDVQLDMICADGRIFCAEFDGRVSSAPDGSFGCTHCVMRDVTEHKRMEKSLRESEDRYRSIFDNAVLGIYRTTPDGKILAANPALLHMLGYESIEELAMRNLQEEGFEPGYSRTMFKESIETKGEVIGLESAWTKHDGARLYVRENAKAIRDDQGRIQCYEGTVEDITEQERTKAVQKLSYQILEISNQHTLRGPMLQEIVGQIKEFARCEAVGIRILDQEGGIPYEAYSGFSREFYERESPLSIRSDHCMCISVIQGRTDPALPFFTPAGSFYMNGTSRFLATVSEEDKGQTRNVCNEVGFESVALIPIRLGDEILGLIHLADSRENRVPLWLVQGLENIAMQLGVGIRRAIAEEALQHSEREKSLILNSTSEMVLYYSPDLRIQWMNKAAEEDLGLAPSQYVGRHCYEIRFQRTAPCTNCPLIAAMKTRNPHEREIVCPDGSIKALRGYPVLDDRNEIVGLVELAQDVTNRRLAEQRLQEREEIYSAIVNQAIDGIVLIDASTGRFVEFNDAACQGLGYTREEFAQLTLQDIQGELSPSQTARHLADIIQTGPRSFENKQRRKDGSLRNVHVANRLVRIRDRDYLVGIWRDITDLLRAQMALLESEEKFRAVFEQAPDSIVLIDVQTARLVEFNRQAYETLGYARDEFSRLTITDVEATESHQETLAHMADIVKEGQSAFTTQHRTRAGRILDVQVRTRAITLGNRSLLVSIWTDISDRRRAERQVQRTTKLLRAIQDAQGLYITGADPEQVYDTLLQTLVTATDSEYGFLDEVFLDDAGLPCKRNLSISGDAKTHKLVRQFAQAGHGFHNLNTLAGEAAMKGRAVIANIPGQDPRYRVGPHEHLQVRTFMGLPMHFGGQVVGVAGVANRPGCYDEQIAEFIEPLVATCAGIIHAVRNHAKEKQYKQALQEREQTARALLNTPGVSAVLMNRDGVIIDLNQAMADSLNKTERDLIGRPIWEHLPQDVARIRRTTLDRVLRSKQSLRQEEQSQDRWSDTVVCPILGADGEVQTVAVLARDITEQKEASKQAELRQTELLHVSRLSTLGEMASGFAHELNQPLSAIMSYASASLRTIQSDAFDQARLATNLDHIVAQSSRAGEIIRRVRAFAQRRQVRLAALNVCDVIHEAIGLLDSDLHHRGIEVILHLSEDLPQVNGDTIQLEQVLLNLMRNAIEAMDEIEPHRRRLTLRACAESADAVTVAVSDEGPGIDAKAMPHMFEPFFTTKENGLGIGLSISRSIIESHRGNLWVTPSPKGGCTFAFTLPAIQSARGNVMETGRDGGWGPHPGECNHV